MVDLELRPTSPFSAGKPFLVLGPSLGLSCSSLWEPCVDTLSDQFAIVEWDLPGHGWGATTDQAFTVADLAVALGRSVGRLGSTPVYFAGCSMGAAVGLQLQSVAGVFTAMTVVSTAAVFGSPFGWIDRAALVRQEGTNALAEGAPTRWFGSNAAGGDEGLVSKLIAELAAVDDESYARCCEALAECDLRAQLPNIAVDVAGLVGSEDRGTPLEAMSELIEAMGNGHFSVVEGAGHLVPLEAPTVVAAGIAGMLTSSSP